MTRQYTLPLPQSEAMSAEDFLPSPANAEAVRILLQTDPSAWSSHVLVLCGPEGSGKSHLLSIWEDSIGAQRVVPNDPVLGDLIAGANAARAFSLDDADTVAGLRDQEEWLQHFYNATKEAHRPVVLTASKPPAQWGLGLRDIETRLKSCACVSLDEPDDELVRGLLLKLFRDRQLMVEADVVQYLAARVERTGTALRHLVARLDLASLETGRKISVPFVQRILSEQESNGMGEKHDI